MIIFPAENYLHTGIHFSNINVGYVVRFDIVLSSLICFVLFYAIFPYDLVLECRD